MLSLSLVIFSHQVIANVFADFSETTETFVISEDAPVGTRVGRVHLTPGFSYRISGTESHFDFDADAGWVTIRNPLDREQCNGSVDLLLVATPPSIIHVVVTILDVNDNAPEFPTPYQNVSLVESSVIGSRISLLPATDSDAGLNGTVVDYRIENAIDEFDLINEGQGLLYLELRQSLDRESKQLVVMNISARDGGIPARIGYTAVYVEILDVNDNAPTFSNRELEAKWNGLAGTLIATLNATDADHDQNGEVVYSIPGLESEHFRIQGDQVFAQKDNPPCCDSPPCSVCFVSVKATDRGVPPLESNALLKILVIKGNLHDPQITIKLHTSNVDFALIESNAVAGRTLAVLTVTDEDGPILDSSPLSIESGNEEGLFDLHIKNHFSMLKMTRDAANIDRSEFDLIFIATDGQVPERKARRSLKIYNEAKLTPSPVVVERDLSVAIPEDLPVGSFVSQVHTNSSRCRFALEGTVPFHVDHISGIITTSDELNVNKASVYNLEVAVQLPPPNIKPVMSTVMVTVVDINEHAPIFVGLPSRLSIAESALAGSTVLTIKANDEDRGENSRITYRLLTADASQYLSIDERSGKLTLIKPLDFEKIREFSTEVEACDNGTPKLCTSADLSILVKDINDNAPEFHCDVTHSLLPLSSPPGTVVATVSASDRDSGLAGRVYYALLDAITGFSIDRATGTIRTTERLQARNYKIRVGAMDGNGVMSTNNATVTLLTTNGTSLKWLKGPDTIYVGDNYTAEDVLATYTTDPPSLIEAKTSLLSINAQGRLTLASPIPSNVDEFRALLIASFNDVSITKCLQLRVNRGPPAPAFLKRVIALGLARDSPLGVEITKVNPGVKCDLKSDCRWLSINSDGVVWLKELVDKSINSLHCIVEARDEQGRTDKLKLHLTMKTTEKPLHLNATYNLRVKEGTRPGAVLVTLANDPAYIFVSNLDLPIDIFPDGSVYVKREVARTTTHVISLPVIAKHRLRNTTYSTVINVYVDDVNNYAPECPIRSQFHIEENSKIGSIVGFLSATDMDTGINGVLGYRLLDNQNLLRVGIATGKITTATVFDAEIIDQIDFKYEVFDHGIPENTAICNATVFIVDVNDHVPKFSQLFYTASVDVNVATENRTVSVVKATDKDRNDAVKYRLLNYMHLFEINPMSGEISRKGRLRGDSRFNVSVAALDKEEKMAETFLIVKTSADYDLHPMFDKIAEPLRVSSSASVGSIVGKVRAVAGSHIVTYRTSSHPFDVDSWGNVILTGQLESSGSREIVVTASTPYRNSTVLLKVEITADPFIETGHLRIEENSIGGVITAVNDDYQVLLTVPQTAAFAVRNRQLLLTSPLDHEVSSTYSVLVGNNSSTRLFTVDVIDVNDNDPECDITTFLAYDAPFSTFLNCSDPDTGNKSILSYNLTSSQAAVTAEGLLTVPVLNETVTTLYVGVSDDGSENTKRTKTIPMHIILGAVRDPEILFPSKEISMLMTSSQPVGTKLGRITAESALPVKYYVIGSSLIMINEDTGIVSTRKTARNNETATILGVSSRGVANVELNIEVIEDQLILPKQKFLFSPQSLASGQSIGSVDLGRDDVSIELTDPFLYIRLNELFLKKDLKFNGAHFYNCSARVLKERVSADIEIYVLPPSVNSPTLLNFRLEYWIRENAPYGSIVGRVPLVVTKNEAPSYSIIGNVGLSIGLQSGILKTTTIFDHETQQLYSFKLRSTYVSGEFFDQDAVLLIDDENDNIPKFEQDSCKTEVREDIEIGAEVLTLRWEDRDFNNAFHLSIVEGNELNLFDVDQKGRITVSKPLDRELLPVHRLVVRLSDGIAPYPYHTTECTVYINLLDVNDNAPVFFSQPEFQVEENSPKMTIIGRAKAFDADFGRNAQVSYRILPESLPWAEFVIDAVHGDIMVNKQLDYERRPNYTFTVVAMDYGMPQLQSVQQITVYVMDINDHDPIVSSNLATIYVDEISPRGTVVTTFQVEDKDTEENSISVFEIVKDYGIFGVSPISGQLFLVQSLDFETHTEYNVTIFAKNIAGGAKSFSSITLRVVDNNDETPRFMSGSPVHFSVVENLPGPYPAIIGSTISEDLDEGENGLVTYSIFEGNTSLFSINSATGELLVLAPLDREEHAEHFLTVQATDSGSPRLSATNEIKITVLDENDNAPEFEQPYYITHVRENSKIGTEVLHIRATDEDEGRNGQIRYSLIGESPFFIDAVTGVVGTIAEVDREVVNKYHLKIQAADSGKHKRQMSITNLTIVIDDENDNNPVIRNKFLDVYVPNDLKTGDVVHVVDAVDNDEDSTLFYNLTGLDAQYFTINGNGEILANKPLNLKAYYSITVAVFDAGGLNTSASFTFYMDDYRKFPKWIAAISDVTAVENSSGNVFKFEARSPRSGPYSIMYAILSGNDGSFSIDPLSGQLSISSELDREHQSVYRLWIAATDSDTPAKTSLTSINIVVKDKNDNSPVFDKVIYSAELPENFDAQELLCVFASDNDEGENAKISYSIASGSSPEAFAINSSTGCLTTTRALDREEIPSYRLIVFARDHGTPSLSAEALVKVTVLDEDDNAPKFSHLFHAEVYESLEVGSPVLLISAIDPDEHDNHTFSIDNEIDTPFSINNITGQIWLRQPLNREEKSSYRLSVRVSDGAWSVQTGAAINILDFNDNAPAFEKNHYVFIVNASQVDQLIGGIRAIDADDGSNGVVYYHFEQDVRYLSIDAVSGEIRLLGVPNRGVITVTIIAQDGGIPTMTSSALVTVVFPSRIETDWEIAVTKSTLNNTLLGGLDDYYRRIGEAKRPNTSRYFLSDDSYVSIDDKGNLMANRDFSERSDDIRIDLILELEDGSAVTRTVNLEISQDNDHSPQFAEKIFHLTVSEDLTRGHLIGTVNATDNDVGLAGKIGYRMQPDDNVPLHMHPNGSIIVSGLLDHEMKKRYIFNVTATDFGRPPRYANAQVVVDLLDANDNPPMFEDKELTYAITSFDDVICPTVSDIDTLFSDLEFVTDSTKAVAVTQHCCIKLYDTVPATIKWTVSDDNHSSTAKIVLIDMMPRKPDIWDEDAIISENSVDDTVVASYQSEVFAEHNNQLSVELKDVKVKGGRGVYNETTTIYAKAKFGRVLLSSKLRVVSIPTAPSPVFARHVHNFNISDKTAPNTVIYNFGMVMPADCQLEIVSGNHGKTFCIIKNGSLAVCGLLRRDHYSIAIEITCDNRTRSRSEILVSVQKTSAVDTPLIGFVRENLASAVIGQLAEEHRKKFSYHIGDKKMREIFAVLPDATLTTVKPLKRSIRSVYNVPIIAQPQRGRPLRSNFVVFVDEDSSLTEMLPNVNATAMLIDPTAELNLNSLALGSSAKCQVIRNDRYEISPTCHMTIKQSIDSAFTRVSINDQNLDVMMRALRIVPKLESSMLQLVLYALPSGIAKLLSELQRIYADLTFYPVAVDTETYRTKLLLTILDRNHNVIAVKDSLEIVKSFLEKDEFPHILLESMDADLCTNISCVNGGVCRRQVFYKNRSLTFSTPGSIWSIPDGVGVARCSCKPGFTGEWCDDVKRCDDIICPDGECTLAGDCVRDCEKTCRNGICFEGTCECMSGFAGMDCSLKVFGTVTERKRKKSKESAKKRIIPSQACKTVNCGDGSCNLERGRPSCRCTDGLIAHDCSYNSHVVSIEQGSITFTPTGQLRTELALNYSPLFNREICNGSQSISIDFRTRKSSGVLVALSYEAEFAVIELHMSALRYRVFDSYRTPIEITLDGQVVDDGNWHQVVLELSEDRKVITFKVDGTGKQAVSRIVLPSIISPDLKHIQLGINGLRGQFSGCLRRFVINQYLQPMSSEESTYSEYFTREVNGDVGASCHFGSAHLALLQRPGVLASILCVSVLLAAILAVFIVARMVRRRHNVKESSWEHAQEIDAYAMRKPRKVPHLGQVNHAMTSSVEGPIYASADGYETPIAHVYRDHRSEIPRRNIGDVVIGVKSLTSSAVTDYNDHSPRSLDVDQQPPRPPLRTYRNVAYF